MELSFCTYNMEMKDRVDEGYIDAQEHTAATLPPLADIFFLQGVGHSSSRPLIKALVERNFKIIKLDKAEPNHTAVAVSNDKFFILKNLSYELGIHKVSRDVAVAVVVEKSTYKKFVLTSKNILDLSYRDNSGEVAKYEDTFLDASIKVLNEIDAHITLGGIVMDPSDSQLSYLKSQGF
ncbi:MAG: hypothetical protein K940chlam3_01291, partial [Chlamydiae bacterium]|nr:hypothetical protein [Chlamydiota bacterium]